MKRQTDRQTDRQTPTERVGERETERGRERETDDRDGRGGGMKREKKKGRRPMSV